MGFMDNFTSDSPVTVKQPDYYEMVKEAAKAELITNAVNAEVPVLHPSNDYREKAGFS